MTFITLIALLICTAMNAVCTVTVLRAMGLRLPRERVACDPPRNPVQWEPLHWVPVGLAGWISRVLVWRGYLVANIASTDGMMLLAIREGRSG